MKVRCQSGSLKMVPFESLGTVSKLDDYDYLNTNTNKIYTAWLTKCPGALTNVKTRGEKDEFLKDF